MAKKIITELKVHLAVDGETGRWFVASSQVPGLNLDSVDPMRLIRRIMTVAPELIELNAVEVERLHGIKPGDPVQLTPVFDSPLQLAA